MDALLASGNLNLSLTFNPAHAGKKWPAVSYLPTATALALSRDDWQRPFVAIPANSAVSGRESGG
jgi:putative thiamine transport system substrate-binding protein